MGAAADPILICGGHTQAARWDALKVVHLLAVETAASATLFLTVFYWVIDCVSA